MSPSLIMSKGKLPPYVAKFTTVLSLGVIGTQSTFLFSFDDRLHLGEKCVVFESKNIPFIKSDVLVYHKIFIWDGIFVLFLNLDIFYGIWHFIWVKKSE